MLQSRKIAEEIIMHPLTGTFWGIINTIMKTA